MPLRTVAVATILFALVVTSVVPAGESRAAVTTVGATRTVKVKKLRAVEGEAVGALPSINRRGQWGADDDPEEYLRLAGDLDVRFSYRVVRPPAIGALVLAVALRHGGGDWNLQVRDRTARRWVTVATAAEYEAGGWAKRTHTIDVGLLGDADKLTVRVAGRAETLDIDLLVGRRTVWQPEPGTTWQWQLTGAIDSSFDVVMYDVDLFEVSEAVIDGLHGEGRIVVCYFSAGAWEDWRSDAGRYPDGVLGADNGWPGERWVDVRRLDVLGPILSDRLDLAVAKGCDGVEPDNVDGYANRSGFPLTAADQLEFNRWLAGAAHRRGLSVGLKNDLEQIPELVRHFDWALNEQCFQYDECELLLPFVDAQKAVFGVEYRGSTSAFCPEARDWGFSWLRKRMSLGAWVVSC